MTPAEKRYFKRHYASDSNTLTDIFDVINGQRLYDEEQVKEQFPMKVAGNLKVYKFQLEQLLLKSLVSYRHTDTVGNRIRMGLEQVDILMERNLIGMAIKQLEKVKQFCEEYEEFTYLIEIAYKEFRLKYIRLDDLAQQELSKFTEVETSLQALEHQTRFATAVNKLSGMYISGEPYSADERSFIEAKLQEADLAYGQREQSFKIRLSILSTRNLCLHMLGRYEEADTGNREVLELYDSHAELKSHLAFYYVGSLRYHVRNIFALKRYDEAKKAIEKGKDFLNKHQQFRALSIYLLTLEMRVAFLLNEIPKLNKEYNKRAEQHIEEFKANDMRASVEPRIYLMLSALASDRIDLATYHMDNIAKVERSILSDLGRLIGLLTILMTHEQGKKEKVKRLIRKYRRQLQEANEEGHEFFHATMDAFFKLEKNDVTGEEAFAELFMDNNNAFNDRLHRLFRYYRLDKWIQAQREDRGFAEVLKAEEPEQLV